MDGALLGSVFRAITRKVHPDRFASAPEQISQLAARLCAEAAGRGFPWRTAFLIGALPALYVFVLRRALPESPRYLSSQGRLDEAESILRSIEKQSGVEAGAALAPDPAAVSASRRARLRDLFGPGVARRTAMLWILWFAMAYSYYGIFTWLPTLIAGQGFKLVQSFQFTLVITLAQIPGYFAAAYFVEKIGRKATLVPFMLLCAASSYVFGSARTPHDLILWGCLVSFFNLGAWGVTYGYTPELYPTWLRGTGTGSAAAFGRIGGVIAPLVVGKLMGAWGGGFTAVFVMFAAVLVAGSIGVVALGEETRGRTLEEISGGL